jgi:hypothetical protein
MREQLTFCNSAHPVVACSEKTERLSVQFFSNRDSQKLERAAQSVGEITVA